MNPVVTTGPNYPALIAAFVSIGSYVSIAFGHPELSAIISDPHTAAEATAVVGGVGALISTFANPVHALITRTAPVTVTGK